MKKLKQVLFIIPFSTFGTAEAKILSLAKAGLSNGFFDPIFVFVSKNPFIDVVLKSNLNYRLVEGYVGLARFLQKNAYGAVHSYGPDKIAEIILNNIHRGVSVVWTNFDKKTLSSKFENKVTQINDFYSNSSPDFNPIGLNLDFIKPIIQNQKKYILVSARSSEELNIDYLCELAKFLIQKNLPYSIKLACNDSFRANVLARISSENIQDKLEIVSFEEFTLNDGLCFLSFNSRISKLEIFEALVNQVPLVIKDGEESRILFETKKVGFLFQDTTQLKDLILSCEQIKREAISLPEQFKIESTLSTYNQNFFTKKELTTDLSQERSDMLFIIIPYSIYGGGEVYLKNHIMKGTFTNVHLIFLSAANSLYSEMKTRVPCSVVTIQDLPSFLVYQKAKKVVFYNSGSVARLLASVKSSLKLTIIEIVHSLLQWADSMHGVDRGFVDETFVVADLVGKQWNLKRYKVLPPTIDEKRFQIPKKSSNRVVVGTVARFSPEKDLKRVVDIANCLDDSFQFVIVGKDGGTKKQVEDYIKQKKLTERVILKDYREDIEQEYATFDCFLLTSKIEGTPLTILEAKASQIPVLAPDIGAIREMIGPGEGKVFSSFESERNIALLIKEQMKTKLDLLSTYAINIGDSTSINMVSSTSSSSLTNAHEVLFFSSRQQSRVCLFSSFHRDNQVSDYIYFCLQKIKDCGFDIVFITTNSEIESSAFNRLKEICRIVIKKPNIGFDFLSWQAGFFECQLEQYEGLLLANDGLFGPFHPLSNVFDQFEKAKNQFCALVDSYEDNYHCQSFFLYFKKSILQKDYFTSFWKNLTPLSKRETVLQYEIGLTHLLMENQEKPFVFLKTINLATDPKQLNINIEEKLKHKNPTRDFWREALNEKNKMPFIKKSTLEGKWHILHRSIPSFSSSDAKEAMELMTSYFSNISNKHTPSESPIEKVSLYQIYYRNDQKSYVSDSIPYDNSKDRSGHCEYGVFMREFSNIQQMNDSKYIGFISWKFKAKANITPKDFLNFIDSNPGYDFYGIQPFRLASFSRGVWQQGALHHPKILETTRWALDELGLDKDIVHDYLDARKLVTCNYWVATKEFWKAYEEFTLPIAKFFIDKAKNNPQLYKELFIRTSPDPARWGAIFPYIMERMIVSFIMKNPRFKTKVWHTYDNKIF